MKPYWEYLIRLPLDEYTKPQVYPTKPKKMPPGEVCKKNSDCKSNKCLGGYCCDKSMTDPNCDTCYSFLYKDMDGFEAINLWNSYKNTNDIKKLESLLAYNYEDTVRLQWLMDESYNLKATELGIDFTRIKHKPLLPNPYKAYS